MADWSIGVDIGSAAVKIAVFCGDSLQATEYQAHQGDIMRCLREILAPWQEKVAKLGLTGSGSRGFLPELLVDDVVAAIVGTKWLRQENFCSLLVVGAERLRFIRLDEAGNYRRHESNSDCASGTGSFIEQQANRLGLTLEEFERLAWEYKGEAPPIATRCAVFARTDLIHRQQEGYSLASIAAGISEGMARGVVDAVIKGREVKPPLLVAGGGCLHRRFIAALSRLLKVEVQPVPSGELVAAVGAARLATKSMKPQDLWLTRKKGGRASISLNPVLRLEKSILPDFNKIEIREEEGIEINFFQPLPSSSKLRCFLGVDIGSTSTKLALADESGKIILGLYTRTASAPVAATQRLFRLLKKLAEESSVSYEFKGVATTGSGRALIGRLIRADLVINEVSAHARAAAEYFPEVDTVIEIGGQDSKFIRLQAGAVVQSLMNTMCAAGTGSFLEEQALKLGMPLSAYSKVALGQEGPAISDRCTVYMERDLSRLQAEGWPKPALLASALHSVRDNYLLRVVGQAKVGSRVCFQGATARNAGLVAAFEVALGRPIVVSPYCHLAGAYGASLLVREKGLTESKFSGLGFGQEPAVQTTETCDLCPNNCRITVVKVGQEVAAWGFQCGREYEERKKRPATIKVRETRKPEKAAQKIIPASRPEDKTARVNIGLPAVLPLAETRDLWKTFFSRLGVEVVVPPPEDEQLLQGQNLAQAEFCAPIYLAHGQVAELFRSGVGAVFFPVFLQGPGVSSDSPLPAYYCYYTSYLPVILKHSPAGKLGRIISPVIDFSWPRRKIVASLKKELKTIIPVSSGEISRAWEEAWIQWQEERANREAQAKRLFASFNPGELAVVLLGRPYNIHNPIFSRDIAETFREHGFRVISQEMVLSLAAESSENNYLLHWHYGQMIMRVAELVARDKRLFPVFLTNFRCSPDSFILTYFRDLMERAGKPYLILQLDGLNSDIGYRTRVEAACESFKQAKASDFKPTQMVCFSPLRQDRIWIIPHVDDTASALACAVLNRFGYEALLAREDQASARVGLGLVGGGECLPTAALLGSIIQTIEKEKIPPERAAAAIPSSLFNCNFPQIPVLVKLLLTRMGLGEVALFTTGLVGQKEPLAISLMLIHAYALADNLRRLVARVRPYEKNRGETEACRLRALERLSRAIRDRDNLADAFRTTVKEFASIPVVKEEPRPLVAIIGDLYVIANPEFNHRVEAEVEAAGGEVLPASLVDITHFSQVNRLAKAWNERSWSDMLKTGLLQLYLRRQDGKWRQRAAEVLKEVQRPLSFKSVKALRSRGVPPELDGETAINLAKVFHFLAEASPDAFLHLNPLYCCPGVVTASLASSLEENYGVPVINLYYDGIHNPNEHLRPYLSFLKEARKKQLEDISRP